MKQKIVWMPVLFAVMILSILLMNHRKTEMMRSGHVFELWDMHEKNINAAARRLAETVNNDPGDGSAICGLFSKEQYDEVYSEASEFANAFTGKGEKIDHLYVDGTFPTIAVYTDEDDPGVAYTEYKELACVLTTHSDVYVATMTAVIGNNNTLAFKEIAVTANNMFHADPGQ